MKLYRRMLVSYLLVCLIPLLLSLCTTVRLERTIQNSILDDKEAMVENIQRETDQKLSDAINTAGVLAADSTVNKLAEKYIFSGSDSMIQQDIINVFLRSQQQQQAITHSFVYFYRSGRLISNSRGYSKQMVDLYPKSINISYSLFFDLLQTADGLYTVQAVAAQDGITYLLVTYNLYTSNISEKLACIGLFLRIPQNLLQWDDENSEVFLIQNGVKIYGSSLATEAVRKINAGGSSQSTLMLDGESYVYSLRESEKCDIIYGFLTKQSEYYQSVRLLQFQIIFELIIYILFGVLSSVFFSRRTWSPFQKILEFVSSRRAESPNYESFDSIQRAIRSLADEKDVLENRLLQSAQQTRGRYISRYLLGFSSDSSALSQYIEDGQPYRLLLFSLIKSEESEFFRNVPQNRYAETLEMLYFAVRNILEEILLENQNGVSTMADDCVVLVVQDTLPEGLLSGVESAVKTTEQALSLSIACYVSPACYHLSEGPAVFKQVQQLYREAAYWQKERQPGVWEVPNISLTNNTDGYPAHTRTLAASLSDGDWVRAEKVFEGILQHDLDVHVIPAEWIRYRLAGLTELLAAYIPNYQEDYLQQIISPGPVEEKQKLLRAQFTAARNAAGHEEPIETSADKNAQWVEMVRQYIEENFQNPSLNASMIADHLGLSLSSLSRRFKNAAGHGVLDEIHMVRLGKAKTLLESGLTVRVTAEKTGYIESRAMIRAFKRYEGITPGQYVEKD